MRHLLKDIFYALVGTYNAWRRQAGISDRQLTKYRNRLKDQPHRRFEAERSNQIHQIDLTELKPNGRGIHPSPPRQ